MGEIEEVEFGDPLKVAEFSICELRSLYNEARKHFDLRLAELEARSKSVPPEDEEGDYLDYQKEEVAALLDLNEDFGVVGAYRTFEMFLRNVVDQLRNQGVIRGKRKSRRRGKGKSERKGYSYIDELKRELRDIGVDLEQPRFQWQEIKRLQGIRNCIAHSGCVESQYVSGLLDYALPEDGGKASTVRLPRGYFLEASTLVTSTCKLVIESCAEARRGREAERRQL